MENWVVIYTIELVINHLYSQIQIGLTAQKFNQ